jgi:hypothetical protein
MSGVKIYDGEKFVNFNISNGIELPVGFEYYVPYSELDSGQLIRDGQIVSRSVYKDLWDFVQKHPSLLLTEEQWQAELSANEGVVNNYYSSGDGSTTFRLPKAGVIELPVITTENINKFSTDTQRNISGQFTSHQNGSLLTDTNVNGAFSWSTNSISNLGEIGDGYGKNYPIYFDASRSVGTEHTGSEVKPKTITKLAVVQAFGRVINTGTLDINDLVNDVNNLIQSNHIKTYTDLSQIGITKGTETLKAIGKALPDNSMLIYSIFPESGHNNVEYPYVSGQFRIIKSKNYCSLYFQTDFGRSYEKYFDDRDSYYVENEWKRIADNNKLSVPSDIRIPIHLVNQGDSYTPDCDGLIWAKKSGTDSGAYMIIADTPEIENSTFGQVLYDDYGGQYVYNIQGCCTLAKNQTMYFFWSYNAIVNFIPFKNNNSTLYGEDYRIYVKVTDADGNILKGANVSILNNDQVSVYNNITYGDGRNFILKKYINVLKNLSSFIVKATYDGKENSISYEWSNIDENKINEITVSLSSLSELKIINTIDGEPTTSTEIGYTIKDSTQTNTVVEEVFSNNSGINVWKNLILDPGTYYIINTSVPDGVSFSLDFIELIITSSDPINKQFSVNLSNGFPLP